MTAAGLTHAEIERQKQLLRRQFASSPFPGQADDHLNGRAAEMLRREPAYRMATRMFISPAPALQQVRINCLLDGKELITAGPGLRDGFYLLKPFTLPFHTLSHAVTMKGLTKAGLRLGRSELAGLTLVLLVTGAVAVDRLGNRLGDGLGFFDLSWAILAELGALDENVLTAAVVPGQQVMEAPLPAACWDVPVDLIVTPKGVNTVPAAATRRPRRLFWQYLPERRTRRITPLWWLRESRPGAQSAEK